MTKAVEKASTGVHWHFSRTRSGTVAIQGGTATADVDLFFALDRFPTTTEASAAVAEDIVEQYPAAKRLSLIERVRTVLPEHPGGGVHYTSPEDGPVIWRLVECSGRCRHTARETEHETCRILTQKTSFPFVE